MIKNHLTFSFYILKVWITSTYHAKILGHDFDEKSNFLNYELSIRLPTITQLKNGWVQERVGLREDVTSSNQDI